MHHLICIFLLPFVSLVLLSGCSENARKKLEPTPLAVGSLNQLAIIADDELWNNSLGDTLNFYFASAYPILPQPEPLFDVKHFTPSDLSAEPTRRELKAYLIVGNLADADSETAKMIADDIGEEKVRRARQDPSYSTNVGRDRWANGQLLIYLFADGKVTLNEQLVKKFPSIAKTIQSHYRNQIDASVYLGGDNNAVINEIERKFGFFLKVPAGFKNNIEDSSSMWLIREGDFTVSNILINRTAYQSQSQFQKNKIISLLDTLGKKYISSTIEGSYLSINSNDLPVITQSIQVNEKYAVEARGIWEMQGDFLGGPFLSYHILDETENEIITLFSFVLAPGERKRNLMLYLEHILQSFELKSSLN